MITVDLFHFYAFDSMLCYVYDFMLNVWSLREKNNEFQLFLFLRIPCKECSEHMQGVRRRGSKFYLRKIRRDIIVLIQAEVQVKHRAVQGVCRLVEALEFIN